MMTFPTELTLRTTRNGVRLFSYPVAELEKIKRLQGEWKDLSAEEATSKLKSVENEAPCFIRATISLSHATSAGLALNGQNIVDYDMNRNTVNGTFYSPEEIGSMDLSFDIILDSTSAEVFIDGGALSLVMELHRRNGDGLNFWGNNIKIKHLQLFSLDSIWE